ncbi:MAG: thermonuclease family protein [Chitinophagales bacterium]|jgi:endonuclease YncB( thermonuclease family)
MNAIFKIIFLFLISTISLKTNANDSARVVRVKDGDTYVLRKGNTDFTVRLKNVDSPELKQPYGYLSFVNTSKLLSGRMVSYDSTGKDLYGRVLADIWVNNQRLDSTLIRNGWAWHYQTYSNDSLLKSIMILAINEHKGLWKCGMTGVCPPSFWRAYNLKNKNKYCNNCK